MQTRFSGGAPRASMLPLVLVACLAGCTNANDPYAKIENPPLVQGRLHTVTLVSDDPLLAQQVQAAGYVARSFPPNYPEADEVLGILWDVPAPVAKNATVYAAPAPGPNLRLLVQPLPPAAAPADAAVERSFFRNVLGSDVPQWPAKVPRAANVRVQVWTYQVPSILEARKRLRASAIPPVTEPVGITTPSMGDQKSMSLRAPDGAIVELIEAAAQ
jgi:hypothetical protein